MESRTKEWLKQADYDMATADYMHQGDRQIYAVFMCHLAVEKALKGLYYEKQRKFPPKSHNLIYLMEQVGIKPPEIPGKFLVKLSEASIPTRYPENLSSIMQTYTKTIVGEMLTRAKETIRWIKKQL